MSILLYNVPDILHNANSRGAPTMEGQRLPKCAPGPLPSYMYVYIYIYIYIYMYI